jgi:hypothetical protein
VVRPKAVGPWRRAGPGTCVVEVAVQRGDGQRRVARVQRRARLQQVRLQRRARANLGTLLVADMDCVWPLSEFTISAART